MQTLNLETNGTLKCLKSSLIKHQENVKRLYKKIVCSNVKGRGITFFYRKPIAFVHYSNQ